MFHQGNWQRVYAAKDQQTLKKSLIISFFFIIPIVFFMGFTGMVSFSIDPSNRPDLGFFTLLLKEQTELLSLIIVILGLALTISTVDTLVNAISSLFVVDGKATFNFNKKTEERIQNKVSEKTKNLTTEEKNNIVKLATSLQKRQESHDDPEILPKVTKEDIPKERKYPLPLISHSNNTSNYYYKSGTNGIIYHSMLFPCDALNNNELAVASLFSNSITDIGLGNDSYESIQKYQSSVTGGISSSFVMLPSVDNRNYKLALKLSGKSLEKNDLLMQELMLRTIEDSRFDETQRIKELLDFISSDNEKSLIQNGHVLAMNNAASQINSIAATNDLTSGIRFINNTSSLSKTITDKDNLEQYIETLKSIKAKISNTPNYLFTASSLEQNNLKLLAEFKL